jgi:hypothetical protein
MNSQTDTALRLQRRIARRSERIAKWHKEADATSLSWSGGMDYKRFCKRMADNAREEQQQLQAELEKDGIAGAAGTQR